MTAPATLMGATAYYLRHTAVQNLPPPVIEPEPVIEVVEPIVGIWDSTISPCLHSIGSTITSQKRGLIIAGASLASLMMVKILWNKYRLRKKCDDYIHQFKEVLGKQVQCKPKISDNPREFESLRTGSSEMPMIKTKYQAFVGQRVGDRFEISGSGFRIENTFVVPGHVVSAAMDKDGDFYIKGLSSLIRVNADNGSQADTDVMLFPMLEVDFSRIGLPRCTLFERLPDVGVIVEITGAQGKGTTGKLRHDYSNFGHVVYSGTTLNGYSGALYMKGKDVVGMHTSGGSQNCGYSASYLKVLVNTLNTTKYEDSEDFLRKILGTKRLSERDVMPIYEHGDVQIRWQGQYHRVEASSWYNVMGKHWEFGNDLYDDSESTREIVQEGASTSTSFEIKESLMNSGESQTLKASGDSGNLIEKSPVQSCLSQQQMRNLQQCLKDAQRQFLIELNLPSLSTNGPRSGRKEK